MLSGKSCFYLKRRMEFYYQEMLNNKEERTLSKHLYYSHSDTSKISAIEWKNALLNIDTDILNIYDKANDIIIISLPYKLSNIKQAIKGSISNNFNDDSLSNCFDVILSFLYPNKKYIQSITSQKN